MRNRFLFQSRYVLSLLVFLFALSFTVGMGYGEEFRGRSGLAAAIAKKAIRLSRDNPRIRAAIEIQNRHTERLMDIFGVLGTATGIAPDGEPVVKVFTSRPGIAGIPKILDSVQVDVKVTGKIFALTGSDNPWWWDRPVPIGASTGNEGECSAGTIGARVTDGNDVFALSNNHVYALENAAALNSDVLQPGLFDTSCNKEPGDVIGTLYDFEPIEFCYPWWFWLICPDNTIDAAIALSSTDVLGNATPDPPEGYGTPQSTTVPPVIGQEVQKYGRTTLLTKGTITAINATFNVSYSSGEARFVDQIVVESEFAFIGHGDSGSLLVTDPDNKPAGLIFAGNEPGTLAVANPIDPVLDRFGVTIDSAPAPTLYSISVTPITATIGMDQNQQFTATGIYGDGSEADLTSIATWHSTDTSVATIDSSPPGLATGVGEGTTYIRASYDEVDSDPAATLNVTASLVNLESISVEPTTATIEVEQTQQFTATGHYDNRSTADLTSTVTWYSTDTEVATIDSSGLATGVGEGTADITATHDGIDSNSPATLEVHEPLSGPHLQTGRVWVDTSTDPLGKTVDLNHDYGDRMVVVCTVNYDNQMPLVPHVQNASGDSFDVSLVPAVWGPDYPNWAAEVHWMVVEAGVYDVENHGVKMEAWTFDSTVTDRSGSWVGETRAYAQAYNNPVVVGQVMSLNSYDASLRFDLWSVFWSRSSSSSKKPPNSTIKVGKHVGEDLRVRAGETIGYVVIEAGEGSIDSTRYVAGLGSDSIRGIGNNPPYTYSLGGLSFNPSTAIVSQAAMDGGNGGWAILYGDNPVTASQLKLGIDEDQAIDRERKHTSEQVAYIVFE